jgi:hypothetical protein
VICSGRKTMSSGADTRPCEGRNCLHTTNYGYNDIGQQMIQGSCGGVERRRLRTKGRARERAPDARPIEVLQCDDGGRDPRVCVLLSVTKRKRHGYAGVVERMTCEYVRSQRGDVHGLRRRACAGNGDVPPARATHGADAVAEPGWRERAGDAESGRKCGDLGGCWETGGGRRRRLGDGG